ncbi:hypothetical protein [Novosphingobium sp. KN65.2]|uniref:hypothetical protein n=1 Tax=Novosphingobium sp. KN65.2 TaxID=1478134 RepID=UPI0006D570FB|nr:hypothetical protein [Novosphingobium sp. KN65.2]
MQAFIRDWKNRGFDGDGSVIIMLSTLEEIDTYKTGCGLDRADYACLSPDKEYASYGIGRAKAGQAKVLFVTHEQARRKMIEAGGFEAIAAFHYAGKPRSLRLWDEGLTPAIPVSFKLSVFEGLVDVLGASNPELAAQIERLRLDNKDRIPGHMLFIPKELGDAARKLGIVTKDWTNKDYVRALEGLGNLAGRYAVLRKDNRYKKAGGLVVVGASAQLPDDLAPCIILDASVPLRQSYKHWERRTGKVEFLPAVDVCYSRLSLHWWSTGANKSTLVKEVDRANVLSVVASTINAKAEERWLVVHPKEVSGCSITDEIKVSLNQDNVEFLHWGRHLGRNDHREIKNVIIIGCLHYGQSGYEALYAASTDRLDMPGYEDGLADGEFAHHVYQAACRSNLRNIHEGVAGDATIYLIAPNKGKRRALLEEAFPACSINDWHPLPPKLTSKEQTFMEVVRRLFADGRQQVTTKEVREECGGSNSDYLSKLWQREAVKDFLQEEGLERRGNRLIRKVGRTAP